MTDPITSAANPRIKHLARLVREPRERRASSLFCLETEREIHRALDADLSACEVFVAPAAPMSVVQRLDVLGVPVISVSTEVLARAAYRENPEGLIAVFTAPTRSLEALPAKPDALYAVCAGVEKPGNLGAILRTADAAGVDAVLLDRPAPDLFNPNCVRASTGAVFSVPVIGAEASVLRAWLKQHGVRLVAADPIGGTSYRTADWSGAVAILLGAEDVGINAAWHAAADACVTIPMRGIVDSLNVSVTAALLLFEAASTRTLSRP